jgi:hypothetical protein
MGIIVLASCKEKKSHVQRAYEDGVGVVLNKIEPSGRL